MKPILTTAAILFAFSLFLTAAREMGITENQINIDMVSFVPVYEVVVEKKRFSKSYNEIPMGFEIQKNLHIRFENSKALDGLVSAAARQERSTT